MKLEEQLLLLPPCYEMGPKEFHGTVRIKPTRFDERLNVRYKRKRGSKDVSRVWGLGNCKMECPERANRKGRRLLEEGLGA